MSIQMTDIEYTRINAIVKLMTPEERVLFWKTKHYYVMCDYTKITNNKAIAKIDELLAKS